MPLAYFNRLITPRGQEVPKVSRAELKALATIGWLEGEIDLDEWRVVSKVMNLDRVKVSQVMTPRTAIVAIPVETSVRKPRGLWWTKDVSDCRFTRRRSIAWWCSPRAGSLAR